MNISDPSTVGVVARDLFAAILGLCVGSFLNVLALRSVKEESLFKPPSTCPHCKERIAVYDLIPVVSYLALNGKCRNCQAQIHWMYPFVEVFTACTFVILLHVYGPDFKFEPVFMDYGNLIGMCVFCSTLIAVCITDFREKLIPHEITYPSMLLGIAYSAVVRDDLQGALVGIGISYMLFDFLAFYGLKFYVAIYGDPDDPEEKKKKVLFDRDREGMMVTGPDPDIHIHHTLYSSPTTENLESGISETDGEDDEEFSVMGGGDAVLSAVISAWLGVQMLGVALLIGFLVGTVMGATYLIYEMYKADVLKNSARPALIGAAIVVVLVEGMLWLLKSVSVGVTLNLPYLQLGLAAAVGGALMGVLRSGHSVSKPFPFGPALAVGAVAAMALKPMIFPP